MLPSFWRQNVPLLRQACQLHHHLCFTSCSSGWKYSDFGGGLEKDISENTVSYSSELFDVHWFVYWTHQPTIPCCQCSTAIDQPWSSHLCFVSYSSGWKYSDFGGDLEKDVSENTISYSSELFGGHWVVYRPHHPTIPCCHCSSGNDQPWSSHRPISAY